MMGAAQNWPFLRTAWILEACGMNESTEKKPYVEPKLERQESLEAVTEGVAPVVTGALPA